MNKTTSDYLPDLVDLSNWPPAPTNTASRVSSARLDGSKDSSYKALPTSVEARFDKDAVLPPRSVWVPPKRKGKYWTFVR